MSSPRTQLLAPLAAFTILVSLGLGVSLAQAGSTLSSCLAACKRSNLSVTNRATCRLDCEVDAASDPELIRAQTAPLRPPVPRPAPPKPSRVAAAPTPALSARPGDPGCKTACDADTTLSADDRATCKLECDLVPDPMPTGTPPMRPPSAAAPASARAGTTTPTTATTPTTPTTLAPTAADARTVADQPGFLDRCYATCKPGRNEREATDHESCKLGCNNMASVLAIASVWIPPAWDGRPSVLAAPGPPVAPAPPVVTRPAPLRRGAPAPSLRATCGPTLAACRATCVTTESKCGKKCGRKHIPETDRETCKLGCGTDQEVCQGDCLSATATCVNDSNPR